MVTILDYGAGNVRSVVNAVKALGQDVRMVKAPYDILNAEKLIFPGVGAFGEVMKALKDMRLIEPLREYISHNRPFWGICLGLQALFEASEESPEEEGLGILKGTVKRFRTALPVPHMGWNGIKALKPSELFVGLEGIEHVYFVHSYFVDPADKDIVLTKTDYGEEFTSAIQFGNVIGTQFHPEKSGRVGLLMLKNFLAKERPKVMPPRIPRKTELSKRIIACLDVRADDEGRLVVTKGDQYDVRDRGSKKVRNLGDPVELAGRYFEEGADEITFLNITGFRDFPLLDMPMLDVLRKTSEKVFVPLTIGGGIRPYTDKNHVHYTALDVSHEYFRSGADKVSIGSDAVLIAEEVLREGKTKVSSIEEIARVYGRQAVVVSIDPKRIYVASPNVKYHVIKTEEPGPEGERYCWFQCTIKGGREGRDVDAITLAKICEELGAGEILLNSIDRDGTNKGFDLELIQAVSESVSIPVIASSGAGCKEHFLSVFESTRAQAALAAGIFHREEVRIGEVKDFLAGKVPVRIK